MPARLKKLKQALQNPAASHNAIYGMREGIINALDDWPVERYAIADQHAPHGGSISDSSRAWLTGLYHYLHMKLPFAPTEVTPRLLDEVKASASLLSY